VIRVVLVCMMSSPVREMLPIAMKPAGDSNLKRSAGETLGQPRTDRAPRT
jgi:hypothetical protein